MHILRHAVLTADTNHTPQVMVDIRIKQETQQVSFRQSNSEEPPELCMALCMAHVFVAPLVTHTDAWHLSAPLCPRE